MAKITVDIDYIVNSYDLGRSIISYMHSTIFYIVENYRVLQIIKAMPAE